MKKPIFWQLICLFLISMLPLASCQLMNDNDRSVVQSSTEDEEENETEASAGEEEEERESGADKQMSMWFHARAYPDPYFLGAKYEKAWDQFVKIRERTASQLRVQSLATWTTLGQSVDGLGAIGGRVKCLAVTPSNSNILWAGSASGGIWKSTNAGSSWSYVPTGLNVLGVSAILVHPTDANIIYAGTGEVYRVDTSNIGFNVWKTRGTYGIGILKSTDGGATWSKVLAKNTADLFAIQAMEFDPTNANTIYAAATDGLYRSTDAGATWSKILNKIYVKDVAINPTNTNQIVVSIGNMVNSDKGIYKTTNGNNASPTWAKITSGLPASFQGSITLDNVGAGEMIASIGVSSTGTPNEVYRSTNFGDTWSVLASSNHCSYQFWFAHTAAINPFATDSIMYAGVNWFRYRVSNTTPTQVSAATVHADVHDIVFDPNVRGRIYVCSDGGVFRSTNGGVSFTAINSGLNATQFYASLGVSSNVTTPNRMIGGLQDNGQVLYNGTQWNKISWAGGDGTTCAIDPSNHDNILASRDARQVYRSTNGGSTGGAVTNYWGFAADSRTGFVAPLAFSKSSPTTVYLASDNLHKSTNSGGTFTNNQTAANASLATNYIEAKNKTAIAIAVSPTNANKVYVSTSPFAQADNDANNIIVTGQPNLLRTTTGGTPFTSIKGSLPDRFVTDIAISPTNDDSVFVTLGGFGTSHVYGTGDGGATWKAYGGVGGSGRISAVLPDVPFNAIVFDPVDSKIIYAACDFGVFVSPDRGANWFDYSTGLTDATQVFDLQISSDNKLIAATHGKGVYKSDLFTGGGTLPVTLMNFTGVNAGSINRLNWTVTQEQDIIRYEVERSTDGVHFSTVGSVVARNQGSTENYGFNDPVGNANAEYYYRLRIPENDGSHTYSFVIFIRVVGKNRFEVLGNPVTDYAVLRYSLSANQSIRLSVFNSAGALLRREEHAATAGNGVYTLYGLSAYPSGLYLLQLESGDTRQTFRLVKK